ncbi:MAG: hypothetical protein LBQ68_10040, partial [Clostridiales bacterium]|nr:hypothetical protein [Clostridiales bacterium]
NANDIFEKLCALEQQLDNEKGSADGKLKILDSLRKELLILDSIAKTEEWPKIEKELKEDFYELEDLISKIKARGNDDSLNMDKIDILIREYKEKIDQIIREKNQKEAKELISDMNSLDFNLRNAVTGHAMDVKFLNHIDSNFGSYHWKNASKARQLINQGLQLVAAGRNTAIRPILVEIIALMPENEKQKDTLE